MQESHWLYNWMDEYGVVESESVPKLFDSGVAVQRLYEYAVADGEAGWVQPPNDADLIAGHNMDLSAHMSCLHHECLSREFDKLFSRVWHYFDKVVIEGPSSTMYANKIAGTPKSERQRLIYEVKEAVETMIHLRRLGVTDYLVFRRKPFQFCEHHLEVHAQEIGITLPGLKEGEPTDQTILDRILEGSEVWISKDPQRHVWYYSYRGPGMDDSIGGGIKQKKKPRRGQVAEDLYRRAALGLVGDTLMSKKFALPLAMSSTILPEWTGSHPSAVESEAALRIELPVLKGVDAGTLLKYREDNWPEYERFRAALREGIREQARQLGSSDPATVAKAVMSDYIQPELAAIERGFKSARSALGSKFTAVGAIGTTVLVVGLIAAAPVVIGAGVAAGGAVIPSITKYFDDRATVRNSDLYFLWDASRRFDKS